jgi:hypothetical protein
MWLGDCAVKTVAVFCNLASAYAADLSRNPNWYGDPTIGNSRDIAYRNGYETLFLRKAGVAAMLRAIAVVSSSDFIVLLLLVVPSRTTKLHLKCNVPGVTRMPASRACPTPATYSKGGDQERPAVLAAPAGSRRPMIVLVRLPVMFNQLAARNLSNCRPHRRPSDASSRPHRWL